MINFLGITTSQNIEEETNPYVELSFPIRGKCIPADHGYALFAACVHANAEIREQKSLSILTIPGFPDKEGKIIITQQSHLRMRLPMSLIPLVYQLAGKSIYLGVHKIQIGIPKIYMLKPASKLKSRIVVIKGYSEPESFLLAAQRQLDDLEIVGKVAICQDRQSELCRKIIKVKRHTIVGFATEVSELNDEDSLKLQQWGIGGKRHFGCGYFLPI